MSDDIQNKLDELADKHGKPPKTKGDPFAAGSNEAGARLRSFIARIENLDDDIKAVQRDRSEVMKEAKSAGFDAKVMREALRLRKMQAPEREQFRQQLELYLDVLES